MDEIIIQKHNFDIAKNKIREFINNLPANPNFDMVKVDGGLFNWGKHKVTGEEMNQFIGEVQSRIISVNNALRDISKEFQDIYNAFDSLDNEYIQGILVSVRAAKKASDEALSAQNDIKDTIGTLQKVVMANKGIKENKKLKTMFWITCGSVTLSVVCLVLCILMLL